MYYRYRVYNALTGHEYADVDTLVLAEAVRRVLYLNGTAEFTEITIDVLVSEPSA